MNNEQLPAYKKQFLQEMEVLRQQKLQEDTQETPSILAQKQHQKYFRPSVIENNIINTAMYSGSNWRHQLNSSSYGTNHDMSHH